MEDALVRLIMLSGCVVITCLNPCFNGRCTRTTYKVNPIKKTLSLNPCFNGRCTRTYGMPVIKDGIPLVLILVLMEDALVL